MESEKARLGFADEFDKFIRTVPKHIYKAEMKNGDFLLTHSEGTQDERFGPDAAGNPIGEVFPQEYAEAARAAMALASQGHEAEFEGELDGRVYRNAVMPDKSGGIAGYAIDITNRKKTEEVARLAFCDPMTGLPNRTKLETSLARETKSAEEESQTALLVISVDNLAKVSQALGKESGDILIKDAGRRIKAALRKDCDLAARLDGDEFAVMLPGIIDAVVAEEVAVRVLEELKRPTEIRGVDVAKAFGVSASIGIAIAPFHGKDGKTLMASAKRALAKANKAGKDNYRFSDN